MLDQKMSSSVSVSGQQCSVCPYILLIVGASPVTHASEWTLCTRVNYWSVWKNRGIRDIVFVVYSWKGRLHIPEYNVEEKPPLCTANTRLLLPCNLFLGLLGMCCPPLPVQASNLAPSLMPPLCWMPQVLCCAVLSVSSLPTWGSKCVQDCVCLVMQVKKWPPFYSILSFCVFFVYIYILFCYFYFSAYHLIAFLFSSVYIFFYQSYFFVHLHVFIIFISQYISSFISVSLLFLFVNVHNFFFSCQSISPFFLSYLFIYTCQCVYIFFTHQSVPPFFCLIMYTYILSCKCPASAGNQGRVEP